MRVTQQISVKWNQDGLADDPEVRSRRGEYLRAAPDGEPHSVIESVSEGVIFSSLTEVLHADYIAVLRPRLSQDEKREAIGRAFRHQGKPYDFEFDFFTSDKLVCTELVYRAYEGFLNFNLVRVMGRDTLPADQIVRKFAAEGERRSPELDFVLFVDWDPASAAPAWRASKISPPPPSAPADSTSSWHQQGPHAAFIPRAHVIRTLDLEVQVK